jgi:hypothetical protein
MKKPYEARGVLSISRDAQLLAQALAQALAVS